MLVGYWSGCAFRCRGLLHRRFLPILRWMFVRGYLLFSLLLPDGWLAAGLGVLRFIVSLFLCWFALRVVFSWFFLG